MKERESTAAKTNNDAARAVVNCRLFGAISALGKWNDRALKCTSLSRPSRAVKVDMKYEIRNCHLVRISFYGWEDGVCVCVWVCGWVGEWEREAGKEGEGGTLETRLECASSSLSEIGKLKCLTPISIFICVCVCVCVWEKDRLEKRTTPIRTISFLPSYLPSFLSFAFFLMPV